MKDYMAPMEGITNHIYRNAYHKYFHSMDKYFTPFISAKPDKRLSIKEIREVSPETNQGLLVIPQILTNHAEDFIRTAHLLMEYGHQELNLNLGCPSGTVTAKGKGSGFLAEPEKLNRFLEDIFSALDPLGVRISIKTRIGTDYEEEWETLLKIYQQYPLEELIVHPRLQKDYYKNVPRLEAYRMAEEKVSFPLCYNGDLFTAEAYERFTAKFPKAVCFMYGRGLIADPGLVSEIREHKKMEKKIFRCFHDEIYGNYREILCGDRNVLFRMKELWNYMCPMFTNYEKYAKKIKKAQRCSEYEVVISSLFAEQELNL